MVVKNVGSENIFPSIELNTKYWAEREGRGARGSTVHPCIYGHDILLQSPTIRDGVAARRV